MGKASVNPSFVAGGTLKYNASNDGEYGTYTADSTGTYIFTYGGGQTDGYPDVWCDGGTINLLINDAANAGGNIARIMVYSWSASNGNILHFHLPNSRNGNRQGCGGWSVVRNSL